jgi:glutaredoxin|tara:strand:+ start:178 stop:408 length:231 start_codon:yes stop_codon:yes gene_type:complete
MFTIYSMPGCGYCRQVQQLMEITEQKFVVYTLDKDFTIEEFQNEFDTKYFPQVVHGDKVIGGAAETVQYFKEKNLV